MSVLAEKFTKVLVSLVPEKAADDFSRALSEFCQLLKSETKLNLILQSPIASQEDKLKLLNTIIKASKQKISDIMLNLLSLLIKANNLAILEEIHKLYKQQLQKTKGLTKVTITFAANPSDKQLKNVKNLLESRFKLKIEITTITDESIIGGFIATFDGKRIDASLNNCFNKLTNKLNTQINLY